MARNVGNREIIQEAVGLKGFQITCKFPKCKNTKKAQPSNFLKANKGKYSETNGYYPYCYNCIRKMITNDDGTISEDGVRNILRDLDYPYIEAIYDTSCCEWENLYGDKPNSQEKVLNIYIKYIKNKPYSTMRWIDGEGVECNNILVQQYKKEEQTDLVPKDIILDSEIEDDEQEEKDKPFKVTKELVDFWGKLKNKQMYKLHQADYERLCEEDGGYIDETKEFYFKNIVILKYLAQEQLAQRNTDGYHKTMKAFQEACEKCGINPKNKIEREDANRGTYGTFIKMIENEHPILDPEKELGTVDYVRKVIEVFFFGHLAKVLNLKNPVQAEYDETMQKYSVNVSTWEDIENIQETPEEEKKDGRRLKVRIPTGFLHKKKSGDR